MKMRKPALITHVEEDLAHQIKILADKENRTVSSLIRIILKEHVDQQG